MTNRVVAVYHNPWPESPLERPGLGDPVALYRYAIWYKANPRNAEYMRSLLASHYPDVEWINTQDDPAWAERLGGTDTVVLLYPDAIGLGFAAVERTVMARKLAWAGVTVINSRRRKFLLNCTTRMGLRLRRFLEWTMLPEFLFLPVFIVATPILWAFDLLRGRT